MSLLLGVDTGGTFTDFVLYGDGRLKVHKVLSTPHAPEQAILQGIADLELTLEDLKIVHGTTVATNAVLERGGVRTAYITNRGFADVLSIGRQARNALYDLQAVPVTEPIAAELCLETGGRLSAQGELLEPLSDADIAHLCEQLEALEPAAVAINLLFSYLDPSLERRIADALPGHLFVSCSSDVLPEYREYERGIATWLNAYVGPLLQGYLQRLEQGVAPAAVAVMQSSAGTVSAARAGRLAVNMLLSGPAGGLMAAQFIGRQVGHAQLLTFDMGGTSTDVALIDGEVGLTTEANMGGYPVAVPMVDMHTIGAGGGSIASVDAGGMLHVGPESAGASPGPACYGRGGRQATVTDANLVLGRIQTDTFLGGRMQLDLAAARQSVATVAEALRISIELAAEGIIGLANEHMVRALRKISLHRGCDPRDYMLASFGGAGGLHVCALAEALQMTRALVPVQAGVLSALGMLVTPLRRQYSRTLAQALAEVPYGTLQAAFKELINQGVEELHQEGLAMADITIRCSLDLRYRGQSYYLNVGYDPDCADVQAGIEAFEREHQRLYGHILATPLELVNIRVAASGEAPEIALQAMRKTHIGEAQRRVSLYGVSGQVPVYWRDDLAEGQSLKGPALVLETVSTTYIAPGWVCCCDAFGNLLLRHH